MTDAVPAVRWNLVRAARPYFGVLIVTVLFLIACGVYAISGVPSGIYPEVAFPRIAVIANVPGLAINSVEVSVTRPIEEAVSLVLGVVRVRSKTVRGAAELSVDFASGTDMVQALNDVRARLAEVGSSLPADTQIIAERQTPAVFPIITIVVTGNRTPTELRDYAFYDLRPRVSRIPDVSYVTVQGGDVREIIVEADPVALIAAHLSIDELATRLAKSNRLKAVGRLDRGTLQYQVMTDTLNGVDETLEDLVVAGTSDQPLRIGDLARVSISHEDRRVAVSSRGHNAVALTVFRRLGGNALAVSKKLQDVLGEAEHSAPLGITVRTVYDQADLVKTSLANVRDAILIGGAFSVVTLLAFLRSVRATLIAALAIPTTLLVSFVFIRLSGDTMNLMSLGGLAIAIGIIIDDTVVVVENIARHLESGAGGEDTVDAASREITGAVIGSTLTTVLVFVPLAFVRGVVGQFFLSLSLSLAIAILVSMVVSLTIMPMLAARFLAGHRMAGPGRVYRMAAGVYERLLRVGIRWPRVSIVLALLVVVPGYLIFRNIESGFMPEMDEGAFVLDYFMPVGTSLAMTDTVLRRVEAIIRDTPEIEDYVRRTGAELGFFATEPYTGDILISLKKDRDRDMQEVIKELRREIAARVPELQIEFVPLVADQINDLSGTTAPVEIKVFGPDYATLREVAGRIGELIEGIDGLADVDAHVRAGNPDIVVRANSIQARRIGLTAESVEAQMETALYGKVAVTLPQEDRLTNVRVRFPDRVRYDVQSLGDTPIILTTGGIVPLRQVASVERRWSLNELWRENQQPMINVTAEIEDRDLGGVTRDIREALHELTVPKGYRVEIAGNYESQQDSFWNLMVVLLVAAALVFVLLAIQFKSVALPLLIFLTQPLSLTSALVALWITHTPLNVSSFMGAILLIGLDVKNGILLIEYVGQLRRQGHSLHDALLEAGRTRFRPILMTSLTAILGLLPLAIGLGPGAQMQQPLAIAVIGGLTANMLFTRLVIPVGYLLLEGGRAGRPVTIA
jgi:CzcA family heavy metal efflux pump